MSNLWINWPILFWRLQIGPDEPYYVRVCLSWCPWRRQRPADRILVDREGVAYPTITEVKLKGRKP